MIYSLTLETALLWVGLALLLGHVFALLFGRAIQERLRAFPRSETAGIVLFVVASAWFGGLVALTDLGEFSPMRSKFLIFTVVGAMLMLRFVREFLAVRALGMLLLLVAEPLLESAWMRPEQGRLWLVGLVYVWIVSGLFFHWDTLCTPGCHPVGGGGGLALEGFCFRRDFVRHPLARDARDD